MQICFITIKQKLSVSITLYLVPNHYPYQNPNPLINNLDKNTVPKKFKQRASLEKPSPINYKQHHSFSVNKK